MFEMIAFRLEPDLEQAIDVAANNNLSKEPKETLSEFHHVSHKGKEEIQGDSSIDRTVLHSPYMNSRTLFY